VERPGPTSPPFPGHGMTEGQRLRTDWFPMLLEAATWLGRFEHGRI